MNITKCDKCQKQKTDATWRYDEESLWVSGSVNGQGIRVSFDLCEKCGRDIVAYAKKFFNIREDKKKS